RALGDPRIEEIGLVRLAPQLRRPRHPPLATVAVPGTGGRESFRSFCDRVRVVEREGRLADRGGRLPHALGPHHALDGQTDEGHGHHHEDDDDSHASPGGDMSEREGRTPRPPLLTRAYFSVKTNIAAPAGKSSTCGHSAG